MDEHLAASGITVDEAEHLARVMYRFESSELLLVGNEAVGLLKLAREGQEWELIQVQLVPRLQRQGLGAGILREVIAEAEVAGAALSLSVLKANPARSLYEHLGFVVEGEDGHEYFMRRLARP
ncbi:N-acetyltransferase [Pelomonas sp. Root1217]|uniref:GNAT family N-acetyltransferase n=1 Tax=Pelomonas sp. Root1217 TaxID=1736430 RepID=UPI0009E798DE|nr:GNAT family N-acetyltransferase [Pelomonas sp. Root1217]